MFDKNCIVCSKQYKGWLSSKYCDKCREKVRKEKRKKYNREYRIKNNMSSISMEEPYPRSVLCADIEAKTKEIMQKEWLLNNKHN